MKQHDQVSTNYWLKSRLQTKKTQNKKVKFVLNWTYIANIIIYFPNDYFEMLQFWELLFQTWHISAFVV